MPQRSVTPRISSALCSAVTPSRGIWMLTHGMPSFSPVGLLQTYRFIVEEDLQRRTLVAVLPAHRRSTCISWLML
jgi:hypothetical protein